MLTNALVDDLVWNLRRGFKKNKKAIWKALEREVTKSRTIRREVNISRLSATTKNEEVVVVPGKLLGSGEMDHKLTVCAFSISNAAFKKIKLVGGEVITLNELMDRHLDGKGVRIIG
jgi:large subunit ribosomal protein L18e